MKRKRFAKLGIGDVFVWVFNAERFADTKAWEVHVECACPKCGATAIVALPPPLRAVQPDETTHVCMPALGGCNHGFERARPAFLPPMPVDVVSRGIDGGRRTVVIT